ncbi:hypothetical protein PTB14_12010 [Enterococcus faecalis]|uniref:hypothetical protein n=1 Tax=Enterococcus faecalis TaxID=1351 RepID=UPI0023613A3A|nr:hypothetical protein [Enterococcus faecalis]MDD0851139.1 hypothetical protein [Enterococcus faecalis]
MKKQLKEKQVKKLMATVKKGAVLAATALILSDSPFAVVTAFAENQADTGAQLVVQPENQMIDAKSTIDQSYYENRVQNLGFVVNNNQFENWNVAYDDSNIFNYSLYDWRR